MSEQQEKKREGSTTAISASDNKEKHQMLLDMGFDSKSINKALQATGNLEAATAFLLGETNQNAEDKAIQASQLWATQKHPVSCCGEERPSMASRAATLSINSSCSCEFFAKRFHAQFMDFSGNSSSGSVTKTCGLPRPD